MKAVVHATASAFLDAVRPTLVAHEAEHHMVLGVAESLAVDRSPNGDVFAMDVRDDGGVALAALMVGQGPLLTASDRENLADAGPVLWHAVATAERSPSHIIGTVGQVEGIVAEWERRNDRRARLAMRQRAYRLTEVEPLPQASGELRVATMSDAELVAGWIAAFEQEALAPIVAHSAREAAERRIAAGEVFLWCDPEPRTMAGSARPTRRAVAVNAVYTPPQWRRHGYATACVAAVSQLLLQRGYAMCVLYTDLANPTSNAIYARIGYRPVRDFLMYDLRGPR